MAAKVTQGELTANAVRRDKTRPTHADGWTVGEIPWPPALTYDPRPIRTGIQELCLSLATS